MRPQGRLFLLLPAFFDHHYKILEKVEGKDAQGRDTEDKQ
jgi:hypothetical protein